MSMSDREERIFAELEDQFDHSVPYLDRHRWPAVAVVAIGYVVGFAAALALMVIFAAALLGAVLFVAVLVMLIRCVDWDRRLEDLRQAFGSDGSSS